MNDTSQRRCYSTFMSACRGLMSRRCLLGEQMPGTGARRCAMWVLMLTVWLAGGVSCQRAGSEVAQGPASGSGTKVRPVPPRPLKPRPPERSEEPADDVPERNSEAGTAAKNAGQEATEKNTEKTQSVDSEDEKPAPEKPAVEKPAPEKPVPEKPVPEKPAPEKPAPEKPVPEKLAPEKPAPEKPAVEKPAAEKPASEKPAPEKPAPEKPNSEKPAVEKPASEKPMPEKPGRQPAKLVPSRKARPLAAPDEPIRQPVMAISDYHRATSVLALGDKLPDFELPDLHGDPHTRRSLLTQPLTVIVFWNAAASSSREQFTRLPQEIWDRFGDARVATLAVHVGPAEAEVEKLSAASAVEFPVLLDVEKTLYSQVAKSRLPRTLLVNQAGEVLWMDLEYSRSMRRELVNAIYFHLSKQPAAAKK